MTPTKLYRVSTNGDYKRILKVIKEDLNEWLWIGKLYVVKITILLKLVYRFYAKAIKTWMCVNCQADSKMWMEV